MKVLDYLTGMDISNKEFLWRFTKYGYPVMDMPIKYLDKIRIWPSIIKINEKRK